MKKLLSYTIKGMRHESGGGHITNVQVKRSFILLSMSDLGNLAVNTFIFKECSVSRVTLIVCSHATVSFFLPSSFLNVMHMTTLFD